MNRALILISIAIFSLAFEKPSAAAIQAINYPGLKITSPDTPISVTNIPGVCDALSVAWDFNNPAAPVGYYMGNCSTTPTLTQFYPPVATSVGASAVSNDSSVSGANVKDALNNLLTAVTSKLSSPALSIFSTATRTLGSCFQISATNDADFHYGVDAAVTLSLGSNTVAATSYSNSGCTTGSVIETSSQDNGIGLGVTRTMRMDGSLQAGRWLKITAATSGGLGSSVTLRADQREIIHP